MYSSALKLSSLFSILLFCRAFVTPQTRSYSTSHKKSSSLMMMAAVEPGDVYVMMNGLPGAMGKEVAAACLRKGLKLAPVALTGPGLAGTVEVTDLAGGPTQEVKLVEGPTAVEQSGPFEEAVKELQAQCAKEGATLVAIDYTHPTAVNPNSDLYCRLRLPFVMGTTGGDRELLLNTVAESDNFAVIAPNMGKPIVAMQAALEHLALTYPGSFLHYSLTVNESHQSSKADTSGTAKDVVKSLTQLTITSETAEGGKGGESVTDRAVEGNIEAINLIREEGAQLGFGVPKEALGGHAFHTYSLKSPDGTVEFQLRHNVCGRRVYAEGTADAVIFLANRIKEEAGKKFYTMIDILEAGGI